MIESMNMTSEQLPGRVMRVTLKCGCGLVASFDGATERAALAVSRNSAGWRGHWIDPTYRYFVCRGCEGR